MTNQTNGPARPQPPIPPQPSPRQSPPIPASPGTPPGWRFQPGNPGTLADTRKVVDNRVIDVSKIYKPKPKALKGSKSSKSSKKGFASNTVASPASIVELARALKNDPQLIFEHVYNNIEWEPSWGVQKGALGCLLDGCGGSFDQSMLLVELLREAGFTAQYVLGEIDLNETEYGDWFNTVHLFASYWYAQYANIPGNWPYWSGTEWRMAMSHVWVEVDIGGNTYALDPSRKTYTRKAAVSGLDTILGYNQTTFLANAASGATITADYAQNVNVGNIKSDLTTMTSNLISYIEGNAMGSAPAGTATVDDVLGGQEIVPLTLPFSWSATLGYEAPGMTPTIWTGDVPINWKTTIQIQFPHSTSGWIIDETFTSDQLAGARLTLTFDNTLHPVLSLNGTVVATGAQAQTLGVPKYLQITVNHNAYASPVYPQQWWQNFIYPGQYYLIGTAWGNLGRGQSNFHQVALAEAKAAASPSNEAIYGEMMACTWYNLVAQGSRVADLVGRMNNTHMNFFHQVGVMSYTISGGTPTMGSDVGGVSGFSSTLDYDFTQLSRTNTVVAMHGVALEASALAQFNGIKPGISTTTVIDKSNRTARITLGGTVTIGDVLTVTTTDADLPGGTKNKNYTVQSGDTLTSIATALKTAINGDSDLQAIGVSAQSSGALLLVSSDSENQTGFSVSKSGGATETITLAWNKTYLATPSNWSSGANVSAALLANGYTSGDVSFLGGYIGTGVDSVMIGETPGLAMGAYDMNGNWVFPDYAHNGGAIGLIGDGAKGGRDQPGAGGEPVPDPNPVNSPLTQKQPGDPISWGTGEFLYSANDLTIGSGAYPYALTFQRFYTSASQYVSSTMGRGWSHGFDLGAVVGNDSFLSMGEQFAIQGAVTLTELFVAMDLAADSAQPLNKLITMSISDKWWVDQLVNNTVVVSLPQNSSVFVKQPDGSYTAPAKSPSTLTLASGAYTVTNPQGLEFNFNSSGKIATIVYPNGVTITFTYSTGKLSTVSNGMGRTLTLSYTGNLVTGVSDGTGRSVAFTYDGSDNLIAATDANGEDKTYDYDNPGRMTAYYLPENPATAFATNVYDSLSRIMTQDNARSQTWEYFFAGARSEMTDPLSNSHVSYFNALGAERRVIDALGNEWQNSYDGLNRLVEATAPEGNQVVFTYDENNNVLTKTMKAKPGSVLSDIVETWTYDVNWAKVATYQDGNGNTTTFTYDVSTGDLLTTQRPVIGMSTPTVTMTYNGRGQMLTVTDETGIVTKMIYDVSTEKMTSIIQDYSLVGGHKNLTTAFGYDSVGNVTNITDPRSNQTTMVWDDLRRMTQKMDPSPFSYVTNMDYDKNGNLLSVERQTGTTPAWQIFSWTYAATNKRLTAVDPASNATAFTYDGKDRLETVTDAESRLWQYDYDANDRLSQVTDPTSTVSSIRTYTDNGRLESIEDARSNLTQFTYDGFDRPERTTFADSTYMENTSYDDNGNVLVFTTRSGNTVTNTWDVLNRLSTKAPTSQPTVTYTYDLAGRLTQVSKPTVSGDPSSGTHTRSYDVAGRFYAEQYPDGKTVTHVLDDNGNRTKTTWPDGYYIDRVFDEMNRLTDIKLNGSGSSAISFSYNDLSQRTQLTYSNGATVVYAPQLNGDVTSVTHNFVGVTDTFTYGFNDVHEPDSVSASDGGYIWHPASAGTTSYGTGSSVNTYPTVGGTSQTYDGNKNLSGDGTWSYTYDTENHLTAASKTGLSAAMVYDPMHRLTQKTVSTTKSRYVYDGWQRIADYDGTSNTLLNRYVYGTSLDEALLIVSAGGSLTFLHHDGIGSVVATSNNSGVVTNRNAIGQFGETTSLSGTDFGFTGQRWDADLGLYYYKMRFYSPTTGRFLQTDPMGYVGPEDYNLYTYCGNSPLAFTDPMGLNVFVIWLINIFWFIVFAAFLFFIVLWIIYAQVGQHDSYVRAHKADKPNDPLQAYDVIQFLKNLQNSPFGFFVAAVINFWLPEFQKLTYSSLYDIDDKYSAGYIDPEAPAGWFTKGQIDARRQKFPGCVWRQVFFHTDDNQISRLT